jgi:hypothetical protein
MMQHTLAANPRLEPRWLMLVDQAPSELAALATRP